MTDTAPHFVKSSFSGGNGGDCVEWACTSTGVQVRDSKHPDGPELRLSYAEWDTLTTAVAAGTTHHAVTPGPHDVLLTGPDAELSFTPAEWRAFTTGTQAGETRPTFQPAT
jgi:hypothetical protein